MQEQLEFEFIPDPGSVVSFNEIPLNHYFTDYWHFWKKVKSGEVMASLSPESPVMQCVSAINYPDGNEFAEKWKPGEITMDYYRAKFAYIGDESNFVIISRKYT